MELSVPISLAWSPDSTSVLLVATDSTEIFTEKFEGASGGGARSSLMSLPHSDFSLVRWHPNGGRIAVGKMDGTVVTHNTATNKKMAVRNQAVFFRVYF